MSSKLYWMEKAINASLNSPDPSTKVGAVVVTPGGSICWSSYNDFHPGIPPEWWNDREKKYKAVIHAEMGALRFAGAECYQATLYVTQHPCRECAKYAIACGIKKVVCPPGPWRDDPGVIATVNDAKELFELCGVEVDYTLER